MYQGHEFRIAPRPAEILTAVFFVDRSFFCGENFTVPGYYFGGAGVICGVTEPKKKKVVVLKMVKTKNGIDSDRYHQSWKVDVGIVDWWGFDHFGLIQFLYEKIIELRKVTVDGSEIRRSPVEVGNLSHYFPGFFYHPRWLFGISSINSRTGQGFNVSSC